MATIDLGPLGHIPKERIRKLFEENFDQKTKLKVLSKQDVLLLATTYIHDSVMIHNQGIKYNEKRTGKRIVPWTVRGVIDEALKKTEELYDLYMNIPVGTIYANRQNIAIKTNEEFSTYQLKLQFGIKREVSFKVADPRVSWFYANNDFQEETIGNLHSGNDAHITETIQSLTPKELRKEVFDFWEEAHQRVATVENLTWWHRDMQEKPSFHVMNYAKKDDEGNEVKYHSKYEIYTAITKILKL